MRRVLVATPQRDGQTGSLDDPEGIHSIRPNAVPGGKPRMKVLVVERQREPRESWNTLSAPWITRSTWSPTESWRAPC